MKLRQYDECLVEFDRAISLDPKNAKYHREKATAYSEMEMFDKAVDEFDKAIESDKEMIDYRRDKANLLMELSRHEDAVRTLDDLLKVKGGYPDLWRSSNPQSR